MKIKTIVVEGEMINRGNRRVSTLAEKTDAAINGFIQDNPVDVKQIIAHVSFQSAAQGGSALYLILYEDKLSRR